MPGSINIPQIQIQSSSVRNDRMSEACVMTGGTFWQGRS
jgi:hypothetical protein